MKHEKSGYHIVSLLVKEQKEETKKLKPQSALFELAKEIVALKKELKASRETNDISTIWIHELKNETLMIQLEELTGRDKIKEFPVPNSYFEEGNLILKVGDNVVEFYQKTE